MSPSFQDQELEILRKAVDKNQKKIRKKIVSNPDIKRIINVVEKFLVQKKRICYGGTAINNILPESDQFYDKSIELPDYDFFSPEPLKDAKDLADIFYKEGFNEVEAKEELIDIWHFLIQASIELNLSPEDILKEYQRKNEINRQREKSGY